MADSKLKTKEITKNIGFYRLRVQKTRVKSDKPIYLDSDLFLDVLTYLETLEPSDKLYDIHINGKKKFHFLKHISKFTDGYNLIFSSAKYEYRPPVIDKYTLTTKDNPRSMTEGDEELTHIKIYSFKDYIDFLIEERVNGITSKGICDYFNAFKYELLGHLKTQWEALPSDQKRKEDKPVNNYRYQLGFIPNNNFSKTLKCAQKVGAGHVYIEKELLGSEFLQYSKRMETYDNEIKLTISNSTGTAAIIEELYNEMQSGDSKMNRIRVEVYDDNNHKSLIDTDSFKLRKSIEVECNIIDGVVKSEALLDGMGSLYE